MTFQKVKNLLSLNPLNPMKQQNKTTLMTLVMVMVMVIVIVLKLKASTNTPITSNLSIHF
jgi:hypothetical protein